MTNTPLNPDALEAVAHERYEARRSFEGLPPWEDLLERNRKAEIRALENTVSAYLAVAQPVVRGYIIVDKKTNEIDWDGELHTSIESAIESMTGPRQSLCRTTEEEDDAANDGRTAWWRIYSIHTVIDHPESS